MIRPRLALRSVTLAFIATVPVGCMAYASPLEVAPEVEIEWVRAYRSATKEWMACGYGSRDDDRVRIDRMEWATLSDSNRVGAVGRCRGDGDLVALVHPHLPSEVVGHEQECGASDRDRLTQRRSRIPVFVIVCEGLRYAIVELPLARERIARVSREARSALAQKAATPRDE